jgi:hypothetical protein
VSLAAQLPVTGLSAAPFGIAERAADGIVAAEDGAEDGATFTQIALAN